MQRSWLGIKAPASLSRVTKIWSTLRQIKSYWKYRHRHLQLRRLHDLIDVTEKPVIVAGDFNTFWGENEIYLFKRATGLRSANTDNLPSYPSRAPRKELDFILYQEGIEVTNFDIPQIRFSDHLPLVCDFEVA